MTRPQLATRPELEARLAQLSSSRPLNRPAPRSYPTRLPARARRRRRGSFAIVTILLLLMATGVGILLADNGVLDLGGLGLPLDTLRPFTSGGESSPASSTATILPVIDAPVLGSEASAFTALFGASEPTAVAEGGPQFQARIAGQSVGLRVQFGIGADRRERVVMIGASDPTLAGWDAATADAICATFLPRDAHLRKFSHVSGQTEYVYTSASLAALFSPAYFVDDSQQAVTPGIFNRLDQPALDPTRGVGACTLGLGQHYGS